MYMYIEPNRLLMALYFILRGIHKARSDNPRGGPYRAALGVRVPTAHARRVATPSDLINLDQGVRVPWTVPITGPIIFTLNESMGMKVTFGSTSIPQIN
jgi:hypothetical protein